MQKGNSRGRRQNRPLSGFASTNSTTNLDGGRNCTGLYKLSAEIANSRGRRQNRPLSGFASTNRWLAAGGTYVGLTPDQEGAA